MKVLFRAGEKELTYAHPVDVSKVVDLTTLKAPEEIIIELTDEQSRKVLEAKEKGFSIGFRVKTV